MRFCRRFSSVVGGDEGAQSGTLQSQENRLPNEKNVENPDLQNSQNGMHPKSDFPGGSRLELAEFFVPVLTSAGETLVYRPRFGLRGPAVCFEALGSSGDQGAQNSATLVLDFGRQPLGARVRREIALLCAKPPCFAQELSIPAYDADIEVLTPLQGRELGSRERVFVEFSPRHPGAQEETFDYTIWADRARKERLNSLQLVCRGEGVRVRVEVAVEGVVSTPAALTAGAQTGEKTARGAK